MRIKAQEVLSLGLDEITFEQPILDKEPYSIPDMGVLMIEQAFAANGLDIGDRLRIIDKEGNLYDVAWLEEDKFMIQELDLKVEYGKSKIFPTWESLEESLPKPYEPYKVVVSCVGKD